MNVEWKLYFDGSNSQDRNSTAGVVLESPTGEKDKYHRDLRKSLSCNQSEYSALITGQEIARGKQISKVTIVGDSKLVCKQVSGNWQVKSESLKPFYRDVAELAKHFESVKIKHIPRDQNIEANRLSKMRTFLKR
jgi:ribonuclease HI